MRPPEMENPAVQGGAFIGVFSIAAEHSSLNANAPAGQRLPPLISRHLGRDFLALWAAGGAH